MLYTICDFIVAESEFTMAKRALQHFTAPSTDDAQLATKLSAATGVSLSPQDIADWTGECGTGPAYNKVDRVVRKYLGRDLYNEAEATARMLGVLDAKLAGKNQATVGGIQFKF